MRKIGFCEAVLRRFQTLMKKPAYHNIDVFCSKWTPICHWSTKFNEIYNNLASQKHSGSNDFDLFKAAREQYRFEMGHIFDY